jgi:quercetin dioxygenase-like cupin family protein
VRIDGFRPLPGTSELPWRETGVEGVALVLLHPGREELDRLRELHGAAVEGTVLIRMDPGRGYPPHRHVGVEEVLVLQGGYRDDQGVYGVGTYVRYEPGSRHAPVALGDPDRPPGDDNPPCVLFATARAGIEILS